MVPYDSYGIELRRRKFEKPFRPFVITTTDGSTYLVDDSQAYAINSYAVLIVRGHRGQFDFQHIASIRDEMSSGQVSNVG